MFSHSYIKLGCLVIGLAVAVPVEAARCLFISSYHPGYEWADGIEAGVRDVLNGHCELRQINMDTKRHKSEAYKVSKGLEIKKEIEAWQPDVVIAADDNASKYVVVPYFINSTIPFVFCGINWGIEEYGYPARNITGMIEVSPLHELYTLIKQVTPEARVGFYIGANTETEEKSFERFNAVAKDHKIKLIRRLVDNQYEWDASYIEAQESDFLILGTESGISDWNSNHARQVALRHGIKFSVTDYDWMMRYVAFGMTKSAREHGVWAAKSALEILSGSSPYHIQIIPSQRWDMYVNIEISERIPVKLPDYIMINSKKYYAR